MSDVPFDPREWKRFDEKSQKQILAAIEAAKKEKRIWYCKRGRTCDGQPHEGANYPHARSDQWPPEGSDWTTFLLRSGRGSGKRAARRNGFVASPVALAE